MAKGGKGGGGPKSDSSTIKGTGSSDVLSDDGQAVTLSGGRGDDRYLVSNAETTIEESRSGGTDEVVTALDWTLGAWLETLTLTGSTDATGEGNDLDNRLTGNDGDNLLIGHDGDDTLEGGRGDDTLLGGAGTDVALFEGRIDQYEITREGGLILVRRDTETDTLDGIETLAFADGSIDAASIEETPTGPLAADDSASGSEDTALSIAVLQNDSGDGLIVVSAGGAGKGTVEIGGNGVLTYRPGADLNGEDSFGYTVRDAAGNLASATVSVTLAAVNDAPEAGADSFAAVTGTELAGTLLTNDSDVDGDPLQVVSFDATSAGGGSVSVAADGSFTYLSAAGFSGSDSFSYTISDGQGGTDTGAVTLQVTDGTPGTGEVPYYVEGLIYGDDWRMNAAQPLGSAVTVTYALLTETPDYYASTHPAQQLEQLTAAERAAVRSLLDGIESLTGITFVETDAAEAGLTVGLASLPGYDGLAYRPEGDGVGDMASDVWIDAGHAAQGFAVGSEAWVTLMHEIGHALGLDHATLPAGEENRKFTVMDGSAHPTTPLEPTGYQLFDVAALQYLYGAGTEAGDDVYTFADLSDQVRTLWDGGGHDRIDLSSADADVVIDLREGAFSSTCTVGDENLSIAYGTVIEDAAGGAGADLMVGNAAANRLDGGAGNDALSGGADADVFVLRQNAGDDRIADFAPGEDLIDLTALGTSYEALEIEAVPGGTMVRVAGGSVLLGGVDTIEADSFLF